MISTTQSLLEAAIEEPDDLDRWLVLADAYEDEGELVMALGARRQVVAQRKPCFENERWEWYRTGMSWTLSELRNTEEDRYDYWLAINWGNRCHEKAGDIDFEDLISTYLYLLDYLGRCESFSESDDD